MFFIFIRDFAFIKIITIKREEQNLYRKEEYKMDQEHKKQKKALSKRNKTTSLHTVMKRKQRGEPKSSNPGSPYPVIYALSAMFDVQYKIVSWATIP